MIPRNILKELFKSKKSTHDNLVKKINKKEETIKELMSNTDYMEWIISFTRDKSAFSSNDWVHFNHELSEYDKENFNKLCLFYEGLDKYAIENNIMPIISDSGNYYNVEYDNYAFEIGFMAGQGIVFYCGRTIADKSTIDFNDIVSYENEKVRQLIKKI